jgi:hypothetical protein
MLYPPVVLSPLFFTTFAEADSQVIRLALRLMRDMELSRFRVFYITRMIQEYGCPELTTQLDVLVRMGFLEAGPCTRPARRRSGYPTYRIRGAFLARPQDLAVWFADRQALAERMTIAPHR